MAPDHISILLDIKTEIGAINSRLDSGQDQRNRLERGQIEIRERIDIIHPVVAVVADLKPKVDEFDKFRLRVGAYVWLGGILVVGVVTFLWHSLSFFGAEIKARLFH